jgi:hypothetical protein
MVYNCHGQNIHDMEHTLMDYINLHNRGPIPYHLQYPKNISDDNITLMDYITQDILLHLKKSMMATKIQKTWLMYKIDKDAEIERLEARYNRLNNFVSTDIKYCKDVDKEPKGTLLKFSHDVDGIDENSIIFSGITELQDGTNRNKSIMTNAINLWYAQFDKDDFFNGACKKYVDSGSSIYWDEWLVDIIKRLENGEIVYLWINLGKYKRLVSNDDKKIIKEFYDAWTKFNEDLIDYDTDELIDYDTDELLEDMELFSNDITESMKNMNLNPVANTFSPGIIWLPACSKKRKAEDIIMELDAKVQCMN